ncbi:hypothetical protein BG00_16010 [Pseudoalteromonas sp. SCSIO_11900]|uniref:hypothetical protein n=1 Tax=Pseudoalteromonas sp. SCSIO_11900 TaxID=1461766 RepID=UPI0004475F36|nr:hypothetical protein [Pseudoalteromonas sp. SCSIO_11900]EWS96826.1 hypothetical protein BG00_16010 [Pseudoalteromonas sp. SCSIO_11900]
MVKPKFYVRWAVSYSDSTYTDIVSQLSADDLEQYYCEDAEIDLMIFEDDPDHSFSPEELFLFKPAHNLSIPSWIKNRFKFEIDANMNIVYFD